MVKIYDANEPSSLQYYCDFLEITKDDFYSNVETLRDPNIWKKNKDGEWKATDSIVFSSIDEREEKARVKQAADRTFSKDNQHLYYDTKNPPIAVDNPTLDIASEKFVVL